MAAVCDAARSGPRLGSKVNDPHTVAEKLHLSLTDTDQRFFGRRIAVPPERVPAGESWLPLVVVAGMATLSSAAACATALLPRGVPEYSGVPGPVGRPSVLRSAFAMCAPGCGGAARLLVSGV